MSPRPEVVELIQYWIDNIQYYPGYFEIVPADWMDHPLVWNHRSDWVIRDTFGASAFRHEIHFDAIKQECWFGTKVKFGISNPRFFEYLGWFLAGDWDNILHLWHFHNVGCPWYCKRRSERFVAG